MAPELRQAFVLRVVLGQVTTLPFVAAGIAVLAGRWGGLYWLAADMVLSILVALFDAWVLLIEINR
jgi:thiol:disulfide interchange protein